MDLETGASYSPDCKTPPPPPFIRAHSNKKEMNHNDDHGEYDPTIKIEFIPPVKGTPAAQALAANAAIKVSKFDKGLHKFRTLKRPKMKSLNIVKKLNKTTKQKRKKKHFSTNFKGKVIDGVHELYTLTAGMMLGIRYSVDQVMRADAPNSILKLEDYDYEETVPFPAKGSTTGPHLTPAHSLAHTFEFKTYSPKVFKRLREFFDIDAVSYMNSVCGDYNFVEFISNSKSGQFFFYSHDGKYMLKTQTKEENKFMRRILPKYYKFMTDNPHSLVVRILGMHRVEMYHLRRKVHFVIMPSVFDSPVEINSIYDLKGSLLGRNATRKERESGGVLKDQDLLDDKRKLHLGMKKAAFMTQLWKDVTFLASQKIMDYSLLIGIHDRSTREIRPIELSQSDSAKHHAHMSVPSRPHSNTPFRKSLQLDSALAIQQALGLPTSPRGDEHGVEKRPSRRYSAGDATLTPTKTEQKDGLGAQSDFSPAQSMDEPMGLEREIRELKMTNNAHFTPHQDGAKAFEADVEEEEYDEEDEDEDEDYEDIDEGDSDADEQSKALRPTSTLSDAKLMTVKPFSTVSDHEGHAYGNGITTARPWTSRADGGVNSRVGRGRGKEIYFMGIIDILQEYNTSKRMETMVKGLTNDVRQISSVDPHHYARRFIEFMDANID